MQNVMREPLSRDAVIVSAVRTPIGKAPNGTLRATRPDDLAALVLTEALRRAPGVEAAEVDDVVIGCAMPEAEQGLNVARIASLRAGLPVSASAVTVNRFCASGLEAVAAGADRVLLGRAEVVLAGGTESMSLVPMGGHHVAPNPHLVESYPDAYLTTGLVAENHARESRISREAQDAFALTSHQRAIAAIDQGRFADEIVPVDVEVIDPSANGRPAVRRVRFDTDEGPRRDTSADALARLKAVFHAAGSVTAGNSSQTSDGAAAVLVMSSDRAKALRLAPLARVVGYATAGVKPELFGIGPVPAIRKVLAQTGLSLADIDLVELNEAFAVQVLACLAELPIDPDRLNVNGGAIALGHPLGCSGARLITTLVHEMKRRRARYGLASLCVGGGMGAAMIVESQL
jgi:acetyl-CoA acyltransferase